MSLSYNELSLFSTLSTKISIKKTTKNKQQYQSAVLIQLLKQKSLHNS